VVEDASMTDVQIPDPSEQTKDFARYVAMVIRNAMEDFHCEHLSDEQMKQLNPIVRNAVCTAFHAFQNYERSDRDRRFVDHQMNMIPAYWESPKLLDDYLRMWKKAE
jgi:hypothetical protein